MIEINLEEERKDAKPILRNAILFADLKQLHDLLKKFKDIFTETYSGMSGVDLQLVTHQLNIIQGT